MFAVQVNDGMVKANHMLFTAAGALLEFDDDGIAALERVAARVNERMENIRVRR
ncbi:hypothetical protein [Gemmatimonas sp.]|uniref:hypothetical protein n=1 Tax=Gemmatimonas sp. TaxID=1962908 RepID=UPI00286CD18C|nr:hypothetical protein [Gemmatimonas sp.]